MELNIELKETIAIINISCKILGTPADSKEFESQIKELLDKNIKKVVLDLSEVKRVNSTGLAILITGFHLMTNSGGSIVLAKLNDFVKGALTITKLDNVFECYDSLDEAVK